MATQAPAKSRNITEENPRVVYKKMPKAGAPMEATEPKQLIQGVDAQQVLVGHEHGHGRHHGRAVEGLAHGARDAHGEQQGDGHVAGQNEHVPPPAR